MTEVTAYADPSSATSKASGNWVTFSTAIRSGNAITSIRDNRVSTRAVGPAVRCQSPIGE